MAWLAGIIDGEGNIQATVKKAHNGKSYFTPKVRIANTDVRMIQRVAELYLHMRLVFFYTINKRKHRHPTWKDMLHIEVASQGSVRRLLEFIAPLMVNKQDQAYTLLELIKFVQTMPKGGNTKSIDYVNSPSFVEMMSKFDDQRRFYIDPSETIRRAGTICSW